MRENSILEPLKMYNSHLKDGLRENAIKYFDELVKKSNINLEENKTTCAKYYEASEQAKLAGENISKHKGLKVFLIVLAVFCFLVALISFFIFGYGVYSLNKSGLNPFGDISFFGLAVPNWVFLLVGLILALGGIGSVLGITLKINKELKQKIKIKAQLDQEVAKFKGLADAQMAPLNAIFDWNMANDVINMTTPLIKMDRYFDMRKYDYMNGKYGLSEEEDEDTSTFCVVSGSINGNPFIVERTFNTEMSQKVYTGSRTVSWRERDARGNVYTRTQTLTATITKPCPIYFYDTALIYGNEAAPKLSFTRHSSNADDMSEKQLKKVVARGEKKLKQREMSSSNQSFTAMGNTEFDVLFGALDRNNEVEFRLLFTPLAQENILDLIKCKDYYGDDFSFYKRGMINMIVSEHSQKQNIYSEPYLFINHDAEISKKTFVEYSENYFKAIFFDLAPLLSIPLYQQHKPKEYIYKETYQKNFNSFEIESLANSFKPEMFKHEESITDVILKTRLLEKNNKSDKVLVRGYSYKGIEHLDYVSVLCRNGNYYNVPVRWIEYIPVHKDTIMEVMDHNSTRNNFSSNINSNSNLLNLFNKFTTRDGIIYQRGLLAFILNNQEFSNEDESLLKNLLNESLK